MSRGLVKSSLVWSFVVLDCSVEQGISQTKWANYLSKQVIVSKIIWMNSRKGDYMVSGVFEYNGSRNYDEFLKIFRFMPKWTQIHWGFLEMLKTFWFLYKHMSLTLSSEIRMVRYYVNRMSVDRWCLWRTKEKTGQWRIICEENCKTGFQSSLFHLWCLYFIL